MRRNHRPFTASAVAAVIALTLAGCVVPADDATPTSVAPTSVVPSTASPLPDDPSTIPPKPTASGIVPAVTVAGVDVDGQSVSASGFVAGVSEDGGGCSFGFTSDAGQTASVSSTGIVNVDTTSCGLVQLPISNFTRGSWTVVLTYTSLASGEYVSEPIELEIP